MIEELDPNICCIKGCDKPSVALGLCTNHWRRNKRWGSPVALRSHSGQFRGMTPGQRFSKQVVKTDEGCWSWRGSLDRYGYATFRAEVDGIRYTKGHRFSYFLHKGKHPGSLLVCHRCDNPKCTNPDHLFLGSNAANMADKVTKGRQRVPVGEDSPHAVLDEDSVKAILIDPRSYAVIAEEYNVAIPTITSIKNRASWRHLDIEPIKGKRVSPRKGVSDKITPEIVREIRASEEPQKALASRFGVSVQTVCDIRKRRSWKHVE